MPDGPRARGGDALLVASVTLDLVLIALAVRTGASEVADGAGRVTTGYNVALSVAGALAVAIALQLARLSPRLRQRGQLFIALAIAAHAIGHLARLYYQFWWFDDALHIVIPGFASVLGVRVAQEARLFPKRHATRARAAFLAALLAIAIAGLWEIFEFSADQLFGTREQDDLVDTMQDMIDGLAGGFFAAAWCWRFPKVRAQSAERKGA